jgi:ribosomal protein L40E
MEMLVIGVVAIAAFAAVLLPLFRRRPGVGDETEFENIPPSESHMPARTPGSDNAGGASAAPDDSNRPLVRSDDDAVETEVMRYREAVRAGTVCRRCGQANPVGSAYCYECGARLPVADAKEFE